MYLLESDIEHDILRQGDIISEIQYFGSINLNNILHHQNVSGNIESWGFKNKPVFGPAVILSHSCELDPSNGIKLTSIILCPLRDINKATSPDKVEELRNTNIITSETEATYLKYFYLRPHSYLPFTDGAIADFSKCFSIHKSMYSSIASIGIDTANFPDPAELIREDRER